VVQERTNVAQHYAPHNNISDQLVISVKEARKLLGQDGKTLSDSQVIELIQTLTVVADNFLLDLGSINYNGI
jgi:ribonuclease HIII